MGRAPRDGDVARAVPGPCQAEEESTCGRLPGEGRVRSGGSAWEELTSRSRPIVQSGRRPHHPQIRAGSTGLRNGSEQQGPSCQWGGLERSHTASSRGAEAQEGQRTEGGASPTALSPDDRQDSSRSEWELSSVKNDVTPLRLATMDSGTAAVGSGPGQPGKSTSTNVSSLQLSVSPVSGFRGGWGPRVGLGIPTSLVGRASPPPPHGLGPSGMGDSAAIHDLLVGLCTLVQRFAVTQDPSVSVPAPDQGQVAGVTSGDMATAGAGAATSADPQRDASKNTDSVRLTDSCQMRGVCLF